jgi:RNA polymerase sigma-70 factor (ECF subfamily)
MNEPIEFPTGAGAEASGDFVCQLIELQPELRAFVAHLLPFVVVRKDILQEVNLLVWEKRGQFEPGTHFRAWVFRFARNVTMNHQKRARRAKLLVFSPETMEMLADDFIEADPVIDERMPALRRCLEKIDPKERRLLLSRYGRHGAVEEAARQAGRSAASLRGMLFRLRIALRRCVEREMGAGKGGPA